MSTTIKVVKWTNNVKREVEKEEKLKEDFKSWVVLN